MSATDKLRKMLDERGVEYKGHYLNTSWYAGMKMYTAVDNGDGTLIVDNLTPEQAIAATLGSEPPYDELLRCLENDWNIKASWDGLRKFWCIELTEEGVKLRDATLGREVNGKTSDGYHTFDELYYHRTALFACLVSMQPRQMAFKSWKHSDGTMYEGFFIAGIYTSGGWCTYHCEAKWWPLFDCHEQEFAPEWDGHTPSDAIHRLMSDFLPSQDVSGEASE